MRLLLTYSLLISLYSSDAFGPIINMRPGQGVVRTTEQNNILLSTIDDNKEKIRDASSSATTTPPTPSTSSTAVTNTNNNALPFEQPKQKQNHRKPHIITTSTTTTTKTISRTVSTYSKHSTSSTFIDLKQGDNKNILDTSAVVSDASVSPTISSSSIPSTGTDTSEIEDKITYDDDEITTTTTVAQYNHVHHIEDDSNDINDTTNEVIQEQEEPPVQPPQLQRIFQKQEEPVLFSEKQLLEQCLEQQTFTLGPTHVDTMKTLYNLANYMYGHDDNDNNEEAIKLFHVCYHQQSFALGQNHPDTVLTLNRLLSFYLDNNAQGENENRYEIAKDLLSSVNGLMLNHDITTNHEYVPHQMDVMTLDTLLKLAFAYHRIGDIDNAMELYESYVFHCAVDESNSTTNVTPTNHHNISPSPEDKLSAQHNLGVLYQNQGLYNMAKPLIEECYTHRKDILGADHPLTLGTMNNLAALLHKCGDYEDALLMYEDCLDVKTSSLGKEHPDTLLTFRNLQRLRDVYVD